MPDTNQPTIDISATLDPASLQTYIDWSYAEHAAAIDTLMQRFAKFADVTAKGIADDYTAGISADFAHDLKQAANALDETRTRIKKPVLHAQRMIDGAARKLTDRLTAAVHEVEQRITAYLRIKEAEARARAEAEARRLALEAEARIAEANAANTEETISAAVETMDAAAKADELANARALELTRTRGVGGALTGLADRWTYEIVALHAVPLHLLQVNDAAVRALIKNGSREIPGLRIWNDAKAYVR